MWGLLNYYPAKAKNKTGRGYESEGEQEKGCVGPFSLLPSGMTLSKLLLRPNSCGCGERHHHHHLITSAPNAKKDPSEREGGLQEEWRRQRNAGVANDYSLNYKTCPAALVNSCRQDNEEQKEHVNLHICSEVSLNFFDFPLLCLFKACDANKLSQESGARRPIQQLQLLCHVSKWRHKRG